MCVFPVSMVGRAHELAELRQTWSRLLAAPSAGPRTAVVTGEAGSGKSLLVAAALDALDPQPRTVLSGRARIHTPAPYDWLAAALSAHDTSGLPVDADVLAWLAQQPGTPSQRYAPGALLRQAVRVVRVLVGDGPAVLVAEDLHALDPASLNLLGELAVAPGLPALLLVTSRPPDEAVNPHLAARTLARLGGAPGAVRTHLGPLRPAEVAALLQQVYGEPVAAETARAVCQRTGGNPYWLTELLAAAGRDGPDALAHDPLPDHVRRLVAGRLVEGDTGDAALRAARDHVAAGLPEAALRAAEVGLRDGHDRLPLLRIGARAAIAATRFADAAGYAARWLALGPAADLRDRAAAHLAFATACGRLGRDRECADQLAAARDLLTEAGVGAERAGAEWAHYLAAYAECQLRAGAAEASAAAARQALDLVGDGGDRAVAGAATVTLAGALDALSEHEQALALLITARRAAAEQRDLDTLGRAVAGLVTRHLPRLDEPTAWHLFDESVATATRFGLEHDVGNSILAGIRLALRVGNAARASELIQARLPVETDPPRRTVLAARAGLLALDGDESAAAGEFADRADTDAALVDDPVAAAAAAQLRVALGGPIEEYADRVPAAHDRRHPRDFAEVARAALAAGTPAAAIRAMLPDRLAEPDSRARRQLDCALLAAEGHDQAAVAAGTAGLIGTPDSAWLDADTELTVARCLARMGRPDEARQRGQRALALLERWPGRLRARVEEFLGSVEAANARPVQEVLTAREMEVLSCLAAGMSNKQVARSLGISVRTVTVHVSNLLRKTRSASRTEAAVWALRHRAEHRMATSGAGRPGRATPG